MYNSLHVAATWPSCHCTFISWALSNSNLLLIWAVSSLKVFFKGFLILLTFCIAPWRSLGVWDPLQNYSTHEISFLCSDDTSLEQWSVFRMTEYGWTRTNQRNVKSCVSMVFSGSYRAGFCSCQSENISWKKAKYNFILVLRCLDGSPDISKKIIFFLTVSVSSSLNSSRLWSRELAFFTEFTVCLSHSAFQWASEGELQDLWCMGLHMSALFQRIIES